MSKKKAVNPALSPEEQSQVEQVLAQFHQIARSLHKSVDRHRAEAALSAISGLSEAAQMVLLKLLSKEQHTDAADVLLALHELSPIKNVRKEARRSLIRLEEARVYPDWQVPLDHSPLTQLTTTPGRFWKGLVTGDREAGELQLTLLWELEPDYGQVRLLGFLLDFWGDGVKDFFTETGNKKRLEARLSEITDNLSGLPQTECGLGEARQLLLEALAINQKHGTKPHASYRTHLSLVKQLILDAPDLPETIVIDEEDEDFVDDEFEDEGSDDVESENVVDDFLTAWVEGDYEDAYQLLAKGSDLREGLSHEAWVERREAWAAEAHPDNLEITFLSLRHPDPEQRRPWFSFSPRKTKPTATDSSKEVEVDWSFTMGAAPSGEVFKELPPGPTGSIATISYKETGRHWFWTSYTLVLEEGEWRIQSMTDEAAKVRSLSVKDIQQKIVEFDEQMKKMRELLSPERLESVDFGELLSMNVESLLDNSFVESLLDSSFQAPTLSLYYHDALIARLPQDCSVYEQASERAARVRENERSAAYLELLLERFSEQHAKVLQQLALTQFAISERAEASDLDERKEHFFRLAAANFRQALTLEESLTTRVMLARVLFEKGNRETDLAEAEDLLHQAEALATEVPDKVLLQFALGDVAVKQERYEQAVQHFRRGIELDPDHVSSWINLGKVQRLLGQMEEAELSLQHALELDPENELPYGELAKIYLPSGQFSKAHELLKQGLEANPDSAELRVYLSMALLATGDIRLAGELLDEAERIDPELELIQITRDQLNQFQLHKPAQLSRLHTASKRSKSSKRKKR